ncbi:MAG: hypothetical protein KC636_22385, partial [Myxococcales bacterium]|nr:hypothetical protein [Myxococcales bacterium]
APAPAQPEEPAPSDSEETPPPPPRGPEADAPPPHQALEHPEALAYFYEQLARVDRGEQTVVRVVHLGASMIGADDITSVLREKFQTRFGDGGAGLVLLQRYMRNYLHNWVKLEASGWESCYIGYLCKKDGFYGLGGATFFSNGGAKTELRTRKHELGDEASLVELWYLAQPGGGRITLTVDDADPVTIETRADALEDRYHKIDVARGPHTVEVKAAGHGQARAYGVVLETDGPGLVWDQFSWLGAFTKRMHGWDAAHVAGQITHRDPALVVFTFGGNDLRRVSNGKLTQAQYTAEFVEGVKNVMAGKPEASCLITSLTDRSRSLTYVIKPEHVEVIVEAQRETAKQAGCAFFDTYAAMGGGGALLRWMRQKPPLAAKDLKHLNHAGRVVVGGWMYDAILNGYAAHVKQLSAK